MIKVGAIFSGSEKKKLKNFAEQNFFVGGRGSSVGEVVHEREKIKFKSKQKFSRITITVTKNSEENIWSQIGKIKEWTSFLFNFNVKTFAEIQLKVNFQAF